MSHPAEDVQRQHTPAVLANQVQLAGGWGQPGRAYNVCIRPGRAAASALTTLQRSALLEPSLLQVPEPALHANLAWLLPVDQDFDRPKDELWQRHSPRWLAILAGTAARTSSFRLHFRRLAAASPQTIAAYRDTLRLLLTFVHQRTGTMPAGLDWDDLDASTISAFLNHLEAERHNSTRTRNVRLTAIRSLFSYAALRHPEHAQLIQRVLAIPPKRFDKRIVTFLTAPEVDALLAAPDQARWEGRPYVA
jgi:hypothetical protein